MTSTGDAGRGDQPVWASCVAVLVASLPTQQAAGVGDLSGDRLLADVQRWERVLSVATAAQAACLVALRERVDEDADDGACPAPTSVTPEQQLTEEVALALRVSSLAASARLDLADGLAQLPATGAALAAGELGVAHARALVDMLTGLQPPPPEHVLCHIDDVVSRATVLHALTPGQVRARVRRMLLALDHEGAVQRRQAATRGRSVSCRPDEHGMAWLSAYLPAPAAQSCIQVLDAHAHQQRGTDPDDARGLGALRADALVNLLLTGQVDGNPPPDAALPATVTVQLNVTVSVDALAGACDEPGRLDGHGPIDASTVRMLADAPGTVIRRLLTDPADGTLVQVGTTRYRPVAGVDRFVRARDVTCRWPGCQRPSRVCDLDHVIPWPEGPTTVQNLIALCRRHHRLKTSGGFGISAVEHVLLVTTPLRRHYSRHLADGWHDQPPS